MPIRKHLFTIALAALTLSVCIKREPITLADKGFYLVSMNGKQSQYAQIRCQFKDDQKVQLFLIKDVRVMHGDVTIGPYKLLNDHITLPRLGSFKIEPTKEGYDLYADGKLKYKLTEEENDFIHSDGGTKFASLIN